MPKIARVPITNIYMGGDYTASILFGPHQKPLNVILDTGSSALALDGHKYSPDLAGGDQTTNLAQTDSYGDGSSWTGAVIKTSIALGDGASQVILAGGSAAIAYQQSANMFRTADGILGLAYAPLDNAYALPGDTWKTHYGEAQVRQGQPTEITPYLTQLAGEDVVSDKIAFLTRRSFIHEGGGGASDPLNQGWLVVGGGEESTDLYSGAFQTVKVLTDEWYNTNLKAIIVGDAAPLAIRARGPKGMPSNSIVDSGTNSLNLGPRLLKALIARFNPAQQAQLTASVFDNRIIAAADLNLASWPDLTFVLQGDAGDVRLKVSPNDYWQVNAPKAGAAMAAITPGQDGFAILGLPLMNGYFTIFDGEADGGRGVIKFATAIR